MPRGFYWGHQQDVTKPKARFKPSTCPDIFAIQFHYETLN